MGTAGETSSLLASAPPATSLQDVQPVVFASVVAPPSGGGGGSYAPLAAAVPVPSSGLGAVANAVPVFEHPRDVCVLAARPHGATSAARPLNEVSQLQLGLAWEFFPTKADSHPVDLDAQCLLYDYTGKLIDAVYYNQLSAAGGAVTHSGDNRTGEGSGDDERIEIVLSSLPKNIEYMAFVISCCAGGSFSNVKSAHAELRDATGRGSPQTLVSVRCAEGHLGDYTSLILGVLYRTVPLGAASVEWHMKEIGVPAPGRNFTECQPLVQAQIDALVPPDLLSEQVMDGRKVFQMHKGDDVRLPKGCNVLTVGLGWTCSRNFDLDGSVIVMADVDGDGMQDIVEVADFEHLQVAFQSMQKPGAAPQLGIKHTGDNLTGRGSGDDETIHIYLDHIPPIVERMVVVVNIYTSGGQFSDVSNAYVRLIDDRPGTRRDVELARFKLSSSIPTNGLIFAALHRCPPEHGGGWKLQAIGEGADGRRAKDPHFQAAVRGARRTFKVKPGDARGNGGSGERLCCCAIM